MDSRREISYPMKTNGIGGLLYGCHKNSPRCSITDLDGWNTVSVCVGIFSPGLTQTHVLSVTDSPLKTIVEYITDLAKRKPLQHYMK
jgi:hypothetical protein